MKVKSNGIEINYEIEGSGPWITLSHSLACDLHMWDPQMALITKSFRVLRFDTRGHGQSSAPAGEYTLEQMADDVKGLLDALDVKQTHWAGLSMGGMIGQTFALRHPGIFQSMVLADTTSRRHPDAAKLWGERVRIAQEKGMAALVEGTLARWFTEPYRKSHPEVMARVGSGIRATPVAGYVGTCIAISKIDLTARLKEIKCPTLIIVGDQDAGTPPEMAREIHANLPGSELTVIPSAAHLSNIEQTLAFNDALTAFYKHVAR
jgi:3-oxoadipate enol-lactonase